MNARSRCYQCQSEDVPESIPFADATAIRCRQCLASTELLGINLPPVAHSLTPSDPSETANWVDHIGLQLIDSVTITLGGEDPRTLIPSYDDEFQVIWQELDVSSRSCSLCKRAHIGRHIRLGNGGSHVLCTACAERYTVQKQCLNASCPLAYPVWNVPNCESPWFCDAQCLNIQLPDVLLPFSGLLPTLAIAKIDKAYRAQEERLWSNQSKGPSKRAFIEPYDCRH